ncbi:MAG TPA: YggS family pyridoxal phosphate-dependent enzyme [Anaerolineaceae bacterium]|nr:YggS family pyridoxal phosphate-dependent enzyme [Anaerolineaceae bacterium]
MTSIERMASQIHSRLEKVRGEIARAAEAVRRDPGRVRLVVVTKLQPVEVIEGAIQAGALDFGENYAEQAVPKIEAIGSQEPIQWHMIGHIQSRKARLVCQYFDWVHSLDSLKLAQKLDAECKELGKKLPALLEFNLGGEESKSGWMVGDGPVDDVILAEIEQIIQLPHLEVCGLMTMPPYAMDAEFSRPYFRRLSDLENFFQEKFPRQTWRELSMGTSSDFPVAIEEGATFIRVGTAILGPRPVKTGEYPGNNQN